jgi:hypothetical protein
MNADVALSCSGKNMLLGGISRSSVEVTTGSWSTLHEEETESILVMITKLRNMGWA